MADVFASSDAGRLFRKKKILYFGDSNVRALYKDMVCLLSSNRLLTSVEIKGKVEQSFLGDKITKSSPLSKGRSFVENRVYKNHGFYIEFHFITKCIHEDVEYTLNSVKNHKQSAPDIVIMNSTLWDLCRWGAKSVELFKNNLMKLMQLFQSCLPKSTMVIWLTAPPLSGESYGGFLIKQIEFTKYTLRFDVMEANMFAHQLISSYGYDIIDSHYALQMSVHWRNKDGIHWAPKAVRYLTNLILTHISLAWGVPLPCNLDTPELTKYKEMSGDNQDFSFMLPKVPLLDISSVESSSTSQKSSYSKGRSLLQYPVKSTKQSGLNRIRNYTPAPAQSMNLTVQEGYCVTTPHSSVGYPADTSYWGDVGNWYDDFNIEGFSNDTSQPLQPWSQEVHYPYSNAYADYAPEESYFGPVRSDGFSSQQRFTPY